MSESRAKWCKSQAWKWRRKGMHDLAEQYEKTAHWHRRGQDGTMECIGQLTIGEAVRLTDDTRALQGVWLAFTAGTHEEAARQRFQAKYGHEPARMMRRLGLLLVGPVTERMCSALADLAQIE